MSLEYAIDNFVFELNKILSEDNIIAMSLKISPNMFPYLKFYQTYGELSPHQKIVHILLGLKLKKTIIVVKQHWGWGRVNQEITAIQFLSRPDFFYHEYLL